MRNTLGREFSRTSGNSPQKPKPAAVVVCFGLAALCFYGAVHEYNYFAEWERVGGERFMNSIAMLIYEVAGKTGIAAIFVAGGIFMVFGGFKVIYILIRK